MIHQPKIQVKLMQIFSQKKSTGYKLPIWVLLFPVIMSGYYLQTPAKIIGFGLEDCKLKEFQPPESAGQSEPSPTKHTMQDGGRVDSNTFSLYCCPMALTMVINYALPINMPCSHQVPYLISYLHSKHLHSLSTFLHRKCEGK
jgi:hypothetical protein